MLLGNGWTWPSSSSYCNTNRDPHGIDRENNSECGGDCTHLPILLCKFLLANRFVLPVITIARLFLSPSPIWAPFTRRTSTRPLQTHIPVELPLSSPGLAQLSLFHPASIAYGQVFQWLIRELFCDLNAEKRKRNRPTKKQPSLTW